MTKLSTVWKHLLNHVSNGQVKCAITKSMFSLLGDLFLCTVLMPRNRGNYIVFQ